jgi:vancomycin permeability regulator SanA
MRLSLFLSRLSKESHDLQDSVKSKPKNDIQTFLAGILALADLFALLILKYYLSGLSLLEFRADYIGNILDFIVPLFFLLGLAVYSLRGKGIDRKRISFILSLLTIGLISLASIVLIEKTSLLSLSGYLFGFPVKKVYVGFFFVANETIQIYSAIYLWGLNFKHESLLEIRSLIRSCAAIIILMIFSLLYVWNVRSFSESKLDGMKFEYGCIPGAAVWGHSGPSPIFEGRLRKALDLYRKGRIKKLILTGGHAPGEISESEAAFKYLVNLQVPEQTMTLETESSTTSDQIKFLRTEFYQQQKITPILMISDGFHLSRIIQMSKFFNVNTYGVSTEHGLSFSKTIFYRARESVALLLFWFFAI